MTNLNTEKQYKVSAKRGDTGKWWGFGNLQYSPDYGNWRLGIKDSPELREMLKNADGGWVNFAFFEKDDDAGQAKPTQNNNVTETDEIPF